MIVTAKRLTLLSFGVAFILNTAPAAAATTSAPPSYGPPSSTQLPQIRQKPAENQAKPIPHPPLPRPVLPPMPKPFGMPGVVGLVKDKWEGTDYLGYLSDKIDLDVEVLKTADVPSLPDSISIEQGVAHIFTKYDITPHAEMEEGPPLPFLHILLFVYPVDIDKFVIFGNSRLFEKIKVERKDFVPVGYWQGITWENQDVSLSNSAQLNDKLRQMADKLAESFAKRFRQYNLRTGETPKFDGSAP